jgi:hypothetical protein
MSTTNASSALPNGNASPSQKDFILQTFAKLTNDVYGSAVASQIEIIDANLFGASGKNSKRCWAEVVYELEIKKGEQLANSKTSTIVANHERNVQRVQLAPRSLCSIFGGYVSLGTLFGSQNT